MSEELKTETIEIPAGKTFSEDYVKTVREEAKENRIARKAAEAEVITVKAKFKALLGLKPEEEFDDAKITAYQTKQQEQLTTAMQKANERLILAEIKSLEGFDSKLIIRLLDKSKVTIAEDGTVTGLKEAVEALALEFPQIKKATAAGAAANPPPAGALSAIDALKQAYALAVKNGKLAETIGLKNQIFEIEHKK